MKKMIKSVVTAMLLFSLALVSSQAYASKAWLCIQNTLQGHAVMVEPSSDCIPAEFLRADPSNPSGRRECYIFHDFSKCGRGLTFKLTVWSPDPVTFIAKYLDDAKITVEPSSSKQYCIAWASNERMADGIVSVIRIGDCPLN